MKKFLMIFLLSASAILAQNSSEYKVFYYGDGENKYSDSLQFAVGNSATGEYYVNNSMVMIFVDSNWTASNLSFMIYNELEGQWEPLFKDGSILEYSVAPNEPVILTPAETAGIKRLKFQKSTSGSAVTQATNPSNLQVATIRFN